ncbi:hypothetical protein OYT1_ch1627 [Ferriphaselus amnicola]|uniref:DUF4224 domain-containing protein n=1 Tax=Ferriphaselus amnicola TaxID=1188319 RepID=A0A2Z6GCR9_9PROT|nr:hypothetical protein [Ferriphaselus amnicola]BBE51174.1 hypothetical protein OYT1_ch1627 [Ferriphaselus amnicola]
MPPWLSQAEIDDLCAPLTQYAAQLRFIRGLGLTVRTKPNGAPLLMRAHFEEVMTPAKKSKHTKCQPNSAGLRLAYAKG